MILKGYLFSLLYLLLIFIISYILYKSGKETLTRKFIHISVSFCFIIFYKYLKNSIHILIIPFIFILFNIVSYKFNIIKPMEENKSLGTIYYAISVFIMCLFTYINYNYYYAFGIGLFIMAFADGLAPIIAKYIPSKRILNNKTLSGSIAVFIISLIVLILFKVIFSLKYGIIEIVIVGILSVLLELVGNKGLDNILLPIGSSLLIYLIGVV